MIAILGMASNPERVDDWLAPKSADTLKNPLVNNYSATAEGKNIFTKKCVICHGSEGKGDGIGGIALNPRPHDLILPLIQKQTDGALFWKITNGKSPMPSYKVILSDEQRWQLVDYVRQLSKQ